MLLKGLFVRYILFPLIALVFLGITALLKRKNQLLNNKTLIVFILLTSLVLAVPGLFGLTGDVFSPYYYLGAQAIYLLVGVVYVQLLMHYFHTKVTRYRMAFYVTVTLTNLTLGGFLFSLLFNLLAQTHIGIVAATCMIPFILPLLFYWAYTAFIDIPYEIYKVWHYNAYEEEVSYDGLDFNRLMVLDLEFSRRPEDVDRLKVKAKAPKDVTFGSWVKKFIEDYNYKFPNNPIVHADADGESHGWIFYVKPGIFRLRRYVDPDANIVQNRIRENYTIVFKRVFQTEDEKDQQNRYSKQTVSKQTVL